MQIVPSRYVYLYNRCALSSCVKSRQKLSTVIFHTFSTTQPCPQRSRLLTRSQPNLRAVREPLSDVQPYSSSDEAAEVSLSWPTTESHAAPDEKPVVRWYHQLTPWSKHRRISDPENPDADDDTGEIKALKKQIDQLDDELRKMQEGSPFEPMLKVLSPQDQAWVKQDWKRKDLHQFQRTEEMKRFLPRLEIRWSLPAEQRAYLQDLNANIKTSLLRFGDYSVRRRLWQSYARCKTFLPPFLHLISPEAWMILYGAQVQAAANEDPHWAQHSIILLEDIRSAGRELAPEQIMLYIEALRFEGLYKEGIAQWKTLRNFAETDKRTLAEYELLGVRLFTSQGDLGKAEQIAARYLESSDRSESRILIPIMDTWVGRRDEIGMKHAWALYLTLKMQLGSEMKMEDYDGICLSFLNRGRTDLALAVFKDMMITGQNDGHDSLELYKMSFSAIGRLQTSSGAIPEVNKIYLTSMTVLPRHFQNKYFYAKWMKKLIGMDEADSAAAVVELMYERRIIPDAKHLNGIVGAWLRTANDDLKSKAERMCWAMINQRLAFVSQRTSGRSQILPDTMDLRDRTLTIPHNLRRRIPAGTIETYALLLQYYARRGRKDDVRLVHGALEMGEITPNSYWINHLLFMDLHEHDHYGLWNRYKNSFDSIVKPDLETFNCLWKCEQSHLNDARLKSHGSCSFPTARTIMHEMVNWLETCGKQQRRQAYEDFSRDLYEDIVRCIVQDEDLAGTIAALHALKDMFGVYPGRKTTAAIVKQVARVVLKSPEQQSKRSARSWYLSQHKAVENLAGKVLNLVQQERAERLVEAGYDDFDQLKDSVRRQERLFVLTEYLKRIMQKTQGGVDVGAKISEAASEMGFAELTMQDHLVNMGPQ